MKGALWPVLLLSGVRLVNAASAEEGPSLFHSMGGVNNAPPPIRQPEETIHLVVHSDYPALAPMTDPQGRFVGPASQVLPRPVERVASDLPSQLVSERVVEDRAAWTAPAPAEKVRRVRSRHLVFNYRLQNVGPSGVLGAELWYTRDDQNWEKAPSGIQPQGSYQVDVSEDGLYGFVLLARTGFGGGKEPPRKGDPAQFWVEVDTIKPVVVITGIKPMAGGRTVLINWKATDKNLGAHPINIYFLDLNNGQSSPIANHLDNTGTYTWQVPAATPNHIRIRIEAVDQAGNVGADESTNPIQLDLSQPEVTDVSINAMD
jgi:hypothetical protein